MIIGYRPMMKGGHGPTKDLIWGAFDHASQAPNLSFATITYHS